MPDTYEEMYRELLAHPVPHEGIVLPNDILSGHLISDEAPTTQHGRLLQAFYQYLLAASASTYSDVLTLSRQREHTTAGTRRQLHGASSSVPPTVPAPTLPPRRTSPADLPKVR